MMLVTAKKPSRKLTVVVTSLGTQPLLSTPTVIIVIIVATSTLKNAGKLSIRLYIKRKSVIDTHKQQTSSRPCPWYAAKRPRNR